MGRIFEFGGLLLRARRGDFDGVVLRQAQDERKVVSADFHPHPNPLPSRERELATLRSSQ